MGKMQDGRLRTTFTYNHKRYFIYGRSEAELERNKFLKWQELENKTERRENPTFDQFYEKWTKTRRQSVKEATLHGQICNYRTASKIVIPDIDTRLGDMKIKDLTVDDMRAIQAGLQDGTRKTQTVNDIMAHLSHALNVAKKERLIDYNPCCLVSPLRRTEELARDTHHRALTEKEITLFFELAKDSYYYDVFRFAILTGMRCGEIGALYNTDIRNGAIVVERTITRLENGGYKIGDSAKTKAGRRVIPLTDDIKAVISHQKDLNNILDKDNVTPLQDTIFKAPERGLLMSTPCNRVIKKICADAGIERFTMHAFRDTFATRALAAGVAPKTLQTLLGHADYSTTMNTYAHTYDEQLKDAMNLIKMAI